MSIDRAGYRIGVVIVLTDSNKRVFWAKRFGQNAWQFPQGGVQTKESLKDAMFRELYEEIGLESCDVQILAETKRMLSYRLPSQLIRFHSKPLCIGQKQRWFLLRLCTRQNINFYSTDSPEFDDYRWISYWVPMSEIVSFKRRVYQQALKEFSFVVFGQKARGYLRRPLEWYRYAHLSES